MAYYYTKDHEGSIREMLNGSGSIVARYNYDAFGNTSLVTGTNLATMQYTGDYYHTTSGLNLTLAKDEQDTGRAYDPLTARWLSRDPLMNAERLQGPNLYEYVGNNPVLYVDPYGEATDSVTQALLDAMAENNADAIEELLDYSGNCGQQSVKDLARALLQKLRTRAGDLIRGRLKRSPSYHSESENQTYEQLLKNPSQAARDMLKLIKEQERLMQKV